MDRGYHAFCRLSTDILKIFFSRAITRIVAMGMPWHDCWFENTVFLLKELAGESQCPARKKSSAYQETEASSLPPCFS
jgi:hypothetical protein